MPILRSLGGMTLAASVFLSTVERQAEAQLIAADSYLNGPNAVLGEYTTGGLNGQDPVIDPGWTGNGSFSWVVGSANLQADTISLTNTALDYPTGGKAKYLSSSNDFFRAGHHRLEAYAPADTYFMSFLVNPGGAFLDTGSREHAVIGFSNFFGEAAFENTSADNVFGLFAGFRGEDAGAATDEIDLILRGRDGSGDLVDTVLLSNAQDTTYHVLYKLQVNNGAGGADTVTYWVNPSDLLNESTLSTSADATGSVDTFAMDQNDRIDRPFVVTNNWARSFFWDETRFGYDLDSVLGKQPITGDMDCDGDVDFDDIDDFVLGLNDPSGYESTFGVPPSTKGDTDGDGDQDFDDIGGFVDILTMPSGGIETVPEPAGLILVCTALLAWGVSTRGAWRR